MGTKATRSFETSEITHPTIQRHIAEDHNPKPCRHESLDTDTHTHIIRHFQ
jgi:hypothetical protein